MSVRDRLSQTNVLWRNDDKTDRDRKKIVPATPASWKLTKQQQEFIALFSEDDHKKQ